MKPALMRLLLSVVQTAPAVAAILIAGCAGGSSPALPQAAYSSAAARALVWPDPAALKKPALITADFYNGDLEYWPIRPKGGDRPTAFSGPISASAYGMAADGNVVVIANYYPAEVITYNVKTKAKTTLPDPYGIPYDMAVGKNGTLYAMNLASVTVYRHGSKNPSLLTCSLIVKSEGIAVDNEGDVFVNGYAPGSVAALVIEYPAGSKECTRPDLRPERGYAGGVAIDPKTDDLIVVDDPDQCAGGSEGRMIIYPKPYKPRTAQVHNLHVLYCAGTIRLNANSTKLFVSDATISAGFPKIDQRSYPDVRNEGTYQSSPSGYSGSFGAFTTIPNTLPN
jgi:hypothetical protein